MHSPLVTSFNVRVQHDRRLDEVTTVEVLSLLQEALKIDRAELKRHKRQIDQKLLTTYGRIIPPDKLSDHVYLGWVGLHPRASTTSQ